MRPNITDDLIEYVVRHGTMQRDKYWKNAVNTVYPVPFGRLLKVEYRRTGKNSIKLITAYWLE